MELKTDLNANVTVNLLSLYTVQLQLILKLRLLVAVFHSALHATCKDALAYLCDPAWDTFERPKIAFRGGWGRPGSLMADHTLLQLVDTFSEVLASESPLNLQVRHLRLGSVGF